MRRWLVLGLVVLATVLPAAGAGAHSGHDTVTGAQEPAPAHLELQVQPRQPIPARPVEISLSPEDGGAEAARESRVRIVHTEDDIAMYDGDLAYGGDAPPLIMTFPEGADYLVSVDPAGSGEVQQEFHLNVESRRPDATSQALSFAVLVGLVLIGAAGGFVLGRR